MQPGLIHVALLIAALPLQAGLVVANQRLRWLTPGEIRFWTIAVFVVVEILYMIVSQL